MNARLCGMPILWRVYVDGATATEIIFTQFESLKFLIQTFRHLIGAHQASLSAYRNCVARLSNMKTYLLSRCVYIGFWMNRPTKKFYNTHCGALYCRTYSIYFVATIRFSGFVFLFLVWLLLHRVLVPRTWRGDTASTQNDGVILYNSS